jgi:hypothetical protein
LVTSK